MPIDNLDQLIEHLQLAIEIEHVTIPPYLCALWSIPEGRNVEAAVVIREVVMQEMLHMTLMANVMNALGHHPKIAKRAVVRDYPTTLPHSDKSFLVDLAPFSRDTLESFRRIEQPEAICAPPEADDYRTIGQFYAAVADGLTQFASDPSVWKGDPAWQVLPGTYFYGGGGDAIRVEGLESAQQAIETARCQGEGMLVDVWENSPSREVAHYFAFDELWRGRMYVDGDTYDTGPSGPYLYVDYDCVSPMHPNPKARDYPVGSSQRELTEVCNRTYTSLLQQLDAAFSGTPSALIETVPTMKQLEYEALALMQMPYGDGEHVAGPAFEWSDGP